MIIAVTTWGRNMVPYWVSPRSYSVGSVKMERCGEGHQSDALDQPSQVDDPVSALDATSWFRRPQAVSVLVLAALPAAVSSTMCGMSSPWSAQEPFGVAALPRWWPRGRGRNSPMPR